ncbi:MAG: hypothetical protein KDD64_13230, partial [Bdellovibrionales bacterium]|nr:hypothetical protein [Bdellovibrionales bacterium]
MSQFSRNAVFWVILILLFMTLYQQVKQNASARNEGVFRSTGPATEALGPAVEAEGHAAAARPHAAHARRARPP